MFQTAFTGFCPLERILIKLGIGQTGRIVRRGATLSADDVSAPPRHRRGRHGARRVSCEKGSAPESLPSVAVRTVVAESKARPSSEEVVGTVRAKLHAVIEAKVSGRIEALAGRAGADGEGRRSDRATRCARNSGEARPGAGAARTGDARSRTSSRVARQKDHDAG